VLVPGDGSDHVQIIDVRDLVEFNIKFVEDRTYGVFNAVGPHMGQPFKQFVASIHKGVGSPPATFTWVDAEFLRANGANPYGSRAPGLSGHAGAHGGLRAVRPDAGNQAGLKFRPTETTARETLAWWRTLPAERQAAIKTGFTLEREKALLELRCARGR
jgi:2'-hydroxyisoflavone reductase